jgi:hypothetical protein
MIEFIQSLWAVGWPVRWIMVITPILVVALVFGYRDMRSTEGDLRKND